jgi:16S rRNA (guanine527-N7)-methyltransferase
VGARALLEKGLRLLGMELTDQEAGAFMLFLEELKRWNSAYSLTSLKSDEDIVVKHFLDSALYLKALPEDAVSVADIGSGAGFPGTPLKILRPDLEVVLIEPSEKKERFLRHLIRKLGLGGLSTLRARAEDVEGVQVDAAVTRALFSAVEFMDKAGHLLSDGGCLILSKGPKAQPEVLEARAAGLEVAVVGAMLPIVGDERNLLVVRRGQEEG